jgi:hypothetical protein
MKYTINEAYRWLENVQNGAPPEVQIAKDILEHLKDFAPPNEWQRIAVTVVSLISDGPHSIEKHRQTLDAHLIKNKILHVGWKAVECAAQSPDLPAVKWRFVGGIQEGEEL